MYVKVSKDTYNKLGNSLREYRDHLNADKTEEECNKILEDYGLSVKCVSIGDRVILNIRDDDTGEIVVLECDEKYNKLRNT